MTKATPAQAIVLAYIRYRLNGQSSAEDLKSDYFPDLKLQSFVEFVIQKAD